jgi:23S rRNA (adenine2503-C2)-methyltransferase
MRDERPHILDLGAEDLGRWLDQQGEPSYRLTQVLQWVYQKRADSFDSMTNLSLDLRRRLAEAFTVSTLLEVERRVSGDSQTRKLLFELPDGERIESVSMCDYGRYTFCISTQAGCALGCRFCATGEAGFSRNVSAHEIVEQVISLARAEGSIGNVVLMGMGEPLLNLDAVEPALDALTDPRRLGLGNRRITVSTAGITPGIRQLARSPAPPNLSLSLNSPFEDQRSELMPINRRHPLREVLEACHEYARCTGRRVTLEYVLLGGVNTDADCAHAVAEIARDLSALVNLIAFNPVEGCGFRPPEPEEVQAFCTVLRRAGVTVTQRYRRGRDIAAGCGQLRGSHPSSARGAQATTGP